MISPTRQAALRSLELKVMRRLDGILQGDYRGLIPGHGTDHGEARQYMPGDDVRRIDWNVTARMIEPHVRDTIADRELETTLVVDVSGSMSFGTALMEKRDLALAGAAALGFVVSRGGNRLGALVAGDTDHWVRHRTGRSHLLGILSKLENADRNAGEGDLAVALRAAERLAKRRGFVAVISDFLDSGPWENALRGLAHRHDVLAMEVVDPRELELPDVGTITLQDAETGRKRFVETSSAELRANYAEAAAEQRNELRRRIRATGAHHLQLSTDRDWVADLIRHVTLRRSGHQTGRRP